MKTILMIGAMTVTLALISYSIAVFNERKKRQINKSFLTFLTLGVILDITATICMIIGSTNSPFTLHGSLGYSALALMMIDTILIWCFYKQYGINIKVPTALHRYTIIAYSWWVIAYITGKSFSYDEIILALPLRDISYDYQPIKHKTQNILRSKLKSY